MSVLDLEAELNTSRAETAAVKGELDQAHAYVLRLLESYVPRYCEPVEAWRPLPDLLGKLTQLDNAITVTAEFKARAAAANARAEALERERDETVLGSMLDIYRQRAEVDADQMAKLEAKLAKAVEARRKADGELWMLEGACVGILSDAEELQRWWPEAKRGSNAKRVFESIMSRRAAIADCAGDARRALTEIEGKSK